MNFFRMIKMDFKRMFLSGKFYFAIAGAMLVTVLNISQEAMQSRWNASVYYLVVSSHGVGAFFEVFSVLAVLPFALSYWEDSRNGYLRCIETSGCKFRIQSHNNGVLHFLRCRSRRRGSRQACCRSAPRSEKRGACRSGCPDSFRVPDRGRAVFLPQLRFHSESAWRRAGHPPRRREHWRTRDKNLSDSVWRVLI